MFSPSLLEELKTLRSGMHTKADAGRSRAAPVCLSILFLLSLMIWQPVWAATPKSAADYYVQNLPGAPSEPQLKMHAG